MLKLIIIDDEKSGRELLTTLLGICCDNIKVVAQAESIEDGIYAIILYRPDIVMLDIRMQDGCGFELLKKFNPIDFKIIFISASEEYIPEASAFNPIDYILKPVSPEYLISAIRKAEKSLNLVNEIALI